VPPGSGIKIVIGELGMRLKEAVAARNSSQATEENEEIEFGLPNLRLRFDYNTFYKSSSVAE
jgi:hypothetical protein